MTYLEQFLKVGRVVVTEIVEAVAGVVAVEAAAGTRSQQLALLQAQTHRTVNMGCFIPDHK